MLKVLELYRWDYEHNKNKNFVVRLNKNFVLNSKESKLTGV
jgi:hypothetical protein